MKRKVHSIGIDVSKKTLDICFLGENFKVIQEFKVINSCEGIQKTLSNLNKYQFIDSGSFVMESTGSYHVLATLLLKEKNYSVKVFNPIISNKYAKGSVRKCKTDKIDARRIAEIGILEDIPEVQITKEMFLLKRKISVLKTLVKQKQVIKSSFKCFLDDVNMLNLSTENSFKEMKKTLDQLEKTISELEKEIQDSGESLPGHKIITEIKGISGKSASIILAQISEKEFNSKKALTAFAGLDVSTKQSGTSINGRGRISKRGNAMLRKTITQVAWGVMMHNKPFKELAEYYKSKGKHYFEIIVIIARKLLHVIYGMLKNNSHFDPAKITIPNS